MAAPACSSLFPDHGPRSTGSNPHPAPSQPLDSPVNSPVPALLLSLGTSPAIVPEAFLLPHAGFRAVHVLTSANAPVDAVLAWFHQRAPDVELSISRVDDFTHLRTDDDHARFEEVLYRWIVDLRIPPIDRHVCVAGGFKTMSAGLQKAAAVFGAASVFHVLSEPIGKTPDGRDRFPESAEEIEAAVQDGLVRWVQLGRESGWPAFRDLKPTDHPLDTIRREEGVRWVAARDLGLRQRLRDTVDRIHGILGGGIYDFPAPPFPNLATWSRADLAWLEQRVDPVADRPWVAALPKIELHCHLGGFATHGTDLECVRSGAEGPEPLEARREIPHPSGWPVPFEPTPLQKYMALGDAGGSTLLKDPGCLRAHCLRLYQHLVSQGVVHAEIRCSPANYATEGRSPWTILEDIRGTFQAAMDRSAAARTPVCQIRLIVIATRRKEGDYRTGIARHLALAVSAADHQDLPFRCRVVGVDLAGYEDRDTRAQYFREDFTSVHRCGLALTVHAGENDDAEGIWQAVFDLNARRLGHALHLGQSRELLRSVADRGIAVEMCPYANFQIHGFHPMPEGKDGIRRRTYPLRDYLQAGVRVTVNTDNIGISAATLTDNLLFAARLCPDLTRMDLLRLQRHAIDAAFVRPGEREVLMRSVGANIPLPHA